MGPRAEIILKREPCVLGGPTLVDGEAYVPGCLIEQDVVGVDRELASLLESGEQLMPIWTFDLSMTIDVLSADPSVEMLIVLGPRHGDFWSPTA